MNNERETHILNATKGLKLRDVQLHASQFLRPVATLPTNDVNARQEQMRGIKFVKGSAELDGHQINLLQVLVNLGMRVVADDQKPESEIFFVIEAEFLVEYEMTENIEDAALGAFANYNAVHNVWPFWRQHVYDIVQRARLPHLDVPLFAGIKS